MSTTPTIKRVYGHAIRIQPHPSDTRSLPAALVGDILNIPEEQAADWLEHLPDEPVYRRKMTPLIGLAKKPWATPDTAPLTVYAVREILNTSKNTTYCLLKSPELLNNAGILQRFAKLWEWYYGQPHPTANTWPALQSGKQSAPRRITRRSPGPVSEYADIRKQIAMAEKQRQRRIQETRAQYEALNQNSKIKREKPRSIGVPRNLFSVNL